jgi:hypothetical protein
MYTSTVATMPLQYANATDVKRAFCEILMIYVAALKRVAKTASATKK